MKERTYRLQARIRRVHDMRNLCKRLLYLGAFRQHANPHALIRKNSQQTLTFTTKLRELVRNKRIDLSCTNQATQAINTHKFITFCLQLGQSQHPARPNSDSSFPCSFFQKKPWPAIDVFTQSKQQYALAPDRVTQLTQTYSQPIVTRQKSKLKAMPIAKLTRCYKCV